MQIVTCNHPVPFTTKIHDLSAELKKTKKKKPTILAAKGQVCLCIIVIENNFIAQPSKLSLLTAKRVLGTHTHTHFSLSYLLKQVRQGHFMLS